MLFSPSYPTCWTNSLIIGPPMSCDGLSQHLILPLPKTSFPTPQHLLAPLRHSALRLHTPLPGSVSQSWPSPQCSLERLCWTLSMTPHDTYFTIFISVCMLISISFPRGRREITFWKKVKEAWFVPLPTGASGRSGVLRGPRAGEEQGDHWGLRTAGVSVRRPVSQKCVWASKMGSDIKGAIPKERESSTT